MFTYLLTYLTAQRASTRERVVTAAEEQREVQYLLHTSTHPAPRLVSLTRLYSEYIHPFIVQELCESRGGRPGLSVLTSLLVSVDVKIY